MVAQEPAYEQLILSVRENWLVVDGGVETLGQKEGLERLLRQVLGLQGVKSEIYVRPASALPPQTALVAEGGKGGEDFKLIVEFYYGEVSAG